MNNPNGGISENTSEKSIEKSKTQKKTLANQKTQKKNKKTRENQKKTKNLGFGRSDPQDLSLKP